ncbi:hypothetical protein [Streptomyces sp. PR69]|uniref:hypothetical protein n=1 Tax=Streptomyces sp. PR69 TaxID=2984950 RepID=UPI002264160E|nr:hypothetical protein [Streptomyces sp. PR69]
MGPPLLHPQLKKLKIGKFNGHELGLTPLRGIPGLSVENHPRNRQPLDFEAGDIQTESTPELRKKIKGGTNGRSASASGSRPASPVCARGAVNPE